MRTICAIATPQGAGGIGIIRLSGERSLEIAKKIFSPFSGAELEPRKLTLGKFDFSGVFDTALAVYFPAPRSFTGQDVVEFQIHGGRFLLKKGLDAVIGAGAVMAEAGEFTKLAYLNGKLALSDAEGIINIINADSEASVKAAYRIMNGELSKSVGAVQNELLDLTASLEAALDYPEELLDDVDTVEIGVKLGDLKKRIEELLSTANTGRIVKDGASVAIIGTANAGKSSLLNKILKCDRAIVSDVPGTTRDTIEESVLYKGLKLNFVDTAGIRESSDVVEKIGIERSKQALAGADVTVLLIDGSKPLSKDDLDLLATYGENAIVSVNKCDKEKVAKVEGISVSALTGEGVNELLDRIVERLSLVDTDAVLITDARHHDALIRANGFLSSAIASLDSVTVDLLLVDIRGAFFALGEITGTEASEDIISRIFEKFCVGK